MSYPLDRFGPSGPPDNFFKTSEAEVLIAVQTTASDFRHWQLKEGYEVVRGSYDADHFKKAHAFLMQDTYPWAGETRQEQSPATSRDRNSAANDVPLAFEKAHRVDGRLNEISEQLKGENYLRGHGRLAFVERLAHYYDQYHQVAPFKAGNLSTLNALTEQLGKGAGYNVNLDAVTNESLLAKADLGLQEGSKGRRQELVDLLDSVTTPAKGHEAELLRRSSLREYPADTTHRVHEAENQRDMLQAGAEIAEKLGGRAGGKPEYTLFKRTVDDIVEGKITPQNVQVVKQLANAVKATGFNPEVIHRFEEATHNLAELKGHYEVPTPRSLAPELGRRGPSQERPLPQQER